MKNAKLVILLFVIGSFMAGCNTARQTVSTTSTTQLLENQEYVFKAQSMIPMRGTLRPLTGEYDIIISRDTVNYYLPYFGRSFTAPIDPTDLGITHVSTNFAYTKTQNRKGNYNVTIIPKDDADVREMNLSISPDGYANLQVQLNNRQPIRFNGVIVERKYK